MLLGMISRGRKPRKEDVAKDMLKYPLAGAFFVGGIVNSALDDYGDFSIAPAAGPTAGVKSLSNLAKGDITKAGRYGLQSAAILYGIPYSQLYRSYKGLLALMKGETQDWRRILWSEYALTKGLPAEPKPVERFVSDTRRRQRPKRKER